MARLLLGWGCLVLLTACAWSPPRGGGGRAPGVVAVLLADNRLVAGRAGDGTLLRQRRLAPAPSDLLVRDAGHFLARSPDGTSLYALVPDAPGGRAPLAVQDRLVTLDATGETIRSDRALPAHGDLYRSLAVGPRSGDVYAFGTAPDGAALVTVADPRTGAIRANWTARPAAGRTWRVYQGAVSADERELWLGYHGPDTTGVDAFRIDAGGPQRCPGLAGAGTGATAGNGCLAAHGGFALVGQRLLVATGTPVILELAATGAVVRGWDTGLERNHLMEFAVDAGAGRLYAVGSCGYVPGFSAVDLGGGGLPTMATPGVWRWRPPPRPPLARGAGPPPCGDRLAPIPGPQLAVASDAAPPALLFVDPASGAIRRSVALPAEPLDLIAGP